MRDPPGLIALLVSFECFIAILFWNLDAAFKSAI